MGVSIFCPTAVTSVGTGMITCLFIECDQIPVHAQLKIEEYYVIRTTPWKSVMEMTTWPLVETKGNLGQKINLPNLVEKFSKKIRKFVILYASSGRENKKLWISFYDKAKQLSRLLKLRLNLEQLHNTRILRK